MRYFIFTIIIFLSLVWCANAITLTCSDKMLDETMLGDVWNPTDPESFDLGDLGDISFGTEADGDIIYYSSSNWTNLPIGSNGQVLKLSAGLPAWGTNDNTGWTFSTTTLDYWFDNTAGITRLDSYLLLTGGVITGSTTIDSTLTVTGDLIVEDIVHINNSNTGITMATDRVQLTAGGGTLLDARFIATDGHVTVNANNGDINFIVDGDTNGEVFFIDATTEYVGIATSVPAHQLSVNGTGNFEGTLTVGAYTLPITDGTANQVLKTDSQGTLYWANDLVGSNIVTLYYHNKATEISGYEGLFTYPNNGTEVGETATSVSESYGLIDSYVSSTTDLSITSLSAGRWLFHTWASVNSNVGTSYIVHNIYKRTDAGVETFIAQATSTELTTDVMSMQYSITTTASTTFATTDDIVIKNYFWTDSVVEKTGTYYYDGGARYSHVDTPISIGELNYARTDVIETITVDWVNTAYPWADNEVADDITASNYLALTAWFATTSHSLINDLPALATVGTITTGVWQGTPIANAYIAETYATQEWASSTYLQISSTSPYVITTLENLDITESQISDFGDYLDESNYFSTTSQPNLALTGQIITKCYPFASTTAILSGFEKSLGSFGTDVTVQSHNAFVENGTTLVINLSDGTSDMDSITASTTRNNMAVSSNNTWDAYEEVEVQFGTNTGGVTSGDYCINYKQN